ncbi:unnamed protein product, partial [Chrysoparadoxa australica]
SYQTSNRRAPVSSSLAPRAASICYGSSTNSACDSAKVEMPGSGWRRMLLVDITEDLLESVSTAGSFTASVTDKVTKVLSFLPLLPLWH